MGTEIVVLIGAGGIGQAIARRQGSGRTVLLADLNPTTLAAAAEALEAAGHTVTTHPVDVASRDSVHTLAQAAAQLGDVVNVVHTAGLSPVQASPEAILAVDLVGVAIVLEEFGRVIAPGGTGLVVSSMAGHMRALAPLTAETGTRTGLHADRRAARPAVPRPGRRRRLRRRRTRCPSGPTTCASRPPPSRGATAAPGSTRSAPGSS